MHRAAKSVMALGILMVVCDPSGAKANSVTSWMLVINTPTGAVAAPTTYDTPEECLAVVDLISSGSPYTGWCIPARVSPAAVEAFVAKRAQADTDAAKRR
jgi:hypothetical protein